VAAQAWGFSTGAWSSHCRKLNFLPEVISGASAGSIMLPALVGTRTDAELITLFTRPELYL